MRFEGGVLDGQTREADPLVRTYFAVPKDTGHVDDFLTIYLDEDGMPMRHPSLRYERHQLSKRVNAETGEVDRFYAFQTKETK